MVMIDNIPSIIFLWCYMFIIWGNLIYIWIKKPMVITKSWKLIFGAFLLLAFGDVFHLVPRTYLWFQYSINHQTDIYTTSIGINVYGFGLIMTGITMTFFYLLFYLFWKEQFIKFVDVPALKSIKSRIRILDGIAFGSVILRTILILLPWNHYGSEPTYYLGFMSFRLLTNLPLYIIGIEVLVLFLKSTQKTPGSEVVHMDIQIALKRSSVWIIVSFITYTITLLGSPVVPLLGMMMIPKTIAYLLVFYYMKKFILLNPSSLKFEKEIALAI
ncbi:hypothetical protein [Candidatus Lokiarchaeum ossiferum]|uniref:hypothetical protein n=1 Tax=Candidatus Lokiarchaeum ossiferum TaxID=2951803 RepID=UPI00352F5DBC